MGAAGSTSAGLTDQERKRVNRRFERLTGKNGSMSMPAFIEQAGLKDSPLMRRILMDFDKSNSGSLSKQDFSSAIERVHTLQSNEDRARMLFQLYDTNKDARISADELVDLWSQTPGGEHMTPTALQEVVHQILKVFDKDGDGQLSLPEFMALASHAERRLGGRQ